MIQRVELVLTCNDLLLANGSSQVTNHTQHLSETIASIG